MLPPLQLTAPGEPGKEWTEYPGGARSAHLASTPEGKETLDFGGKKNTGRNTRLIKDGEVRGSEFFFFFISHLLSPPK